ncbi:MAG: DUF3300 domain-containing protein [Deltaproteobacteria bacterium HGW-Deltaproteobacteria-4]|nr:MAG: DUF3300 domain-containing protein [Deltaproteobacteria bacterium HGW-Deltaproteobacteria-4]
MRVLAPTLCRMIWIVITLLVLPAGIMAQVAGDFDQEYKFSKEELTQMLAPIALYPDALTAQILMASTYPLEVVEAERWRGQNLHLEGKDLDDALLDMNWDPSVKSLCHFPDILKSMSDKLDQTRKLGDAFLGQEEEVLATVQELRGKAIEQGNLSTTTEQKVIVEDEIVKIEPANPQFIYVPVYDPFYVYGPWWYPAYPPYYWYYPSGFYGGVSIGFSSGIYFGFNTFSWTWFDWPYYRVYIDTNRTRSFHRHYDRRDEIRYVWRHNPQHRKGVAYRDLRTSERFSVRTPRVSSPSDLERRGYPGGRIEQPKVRSLQPRSQRGERQVPSQAPQIRQIPATRPPASVIRREGVTPPRVQSGSDILQRPVQRDNPFRGVGEGSFERRAGERGAISNRSNVMRQQTDGSLGGQLKQRPGGDPRGDVRGGDSRRER